MRAGFAVLYRHPDVEVVVIDGKSLYRGFLQGGGLAVLHQVGVQVARHAVVRAGVGAVGRDVHLQHVVALNVVIVLGKRTRHCCFGQHDDARMVCADAYFVFGTNHAVGLYAAEFGFLDCEAFITVIKFCTQSGYHHFLSGCHVGCAAYYLHRFSLSQVYGSDVHVVRVGMGLARQHFADDQAFQSAFNGLHLFHASRFQSYGSERGGYFIRCQVEIHILFQPVIRDIHIIIFLLFPKVTRKVNKIFL